MRNVLSCLLLLLSVLLISLSDVNAYPKLDFLESKNGHQRGLKDLSWASFDHLEDNNRAPREKDLKKIQEILGIRNQSENLAHHKVPQFMMELYNTVTDSSRDTQSQNPYNAKLVRSFIEGDTSLPNFYFFNVSGLEINESVLGAELHLYRKKMPMENFSSNPYYLIRLYQILDDHSLDAPNLHRLLDVYHVGAHAFGWQVFDVTQAVLAWLNGDPNLGLLVTASNLFENKVSVEFSRRDDYHHNKQPILVLFDDVNSNHNQSSKPSYYTYGNQVKEDGEVEEESKEEESEEKEDYKKEKKEDEEINLKNDYNETERYSRFKRLREDGQPEEVLLAVTRREPEFFQRQKRRRDKKNKERENNEPDDYDDYYDSQDQESETLTLGAAMTRRRRDVASSEKHMARIVSKNHTRKIPRILTSMDIYERAEFRERLGRMTRNQSITRQRRSADNKNTMIQSNTTETCTRHELYVDFLDIGLSSIIAPPGYFAYQCKGMCESPLSQDQRPTNHATIQAIVHKVGLVKDVEKPCCVPIKLQSISILFFDSENVVLKNYEDMVAERCGCR
ncbi:bone morphogenetic protein 4 [Polyergus mexicanus]|uniref:bone morphogenetic protein 4 n=1 Tax=Polyergus mexicanus TaxID=615972 RepID=UPI0038B57A9F